MRRVIKFHMLCALLVGCSASFAGPVEHLIIIGCDGMSPDGVQNANTPNLDRMMREGAYSMHARAVMPTMSSPNWASMINGAGPEQHGVLNNDWKAGVSAITPVAESIPGMFPTIFWVLRQQRPDARIACFHDWSGFAALFETQAADVVEDTHGAKATAKRAAKYIVDEKPTFCFVHLDKIDEVGHDVGHGTPEYYKAVEEVDGYIGRLRRAVLDAGIADSTAIIVTSDHGGKKRGHGRPTMAEIEIPWFIVGAGVLKGKEISEPINIYDTAATAAYLLGIDAHAAWIARPVLGALEANR